MTDPTADWGQEDFPDPTSDAYDGFDDWSSEGVDATKIGSGRVEVDCEGYYHFSIEATEKPSPYGTDRKTGEVDMAYTRRPSILLALTVLHSAKDQSPAGATLYHELIMGGKGPGAPVEAWAKEQTLNFLVGCGILQNRGGEVIDPETGTTRLKASTLAKRLNGLQFIGHVKFSKGQPNPAKPGENYPDSYGFPFGRGAFTLDDPRVAHIAKDVESLRKIGKEHLAVAGSKPPVPPPVNAPAKQAPANAPAKPALNSLPDDM